MTSVPLGLLAAISASGMYYGGMAVQALEARSEPVGRAGRAGRSSLLLRLVRRPRWLLGTGLTVLGVPLQALALLLAPLSIVQPALVVGLVLLLAVGQRVLHERVTRRSAGAALAVMLGVAVLAVVSPAGDPKGGVSLGGAAALVALGLLALTPYLPSGVLRGSRGLMPIGAGLAYAWAAIAVKLATDHLNGGRWVAALAWGLAAGAAAVLATSSEMSSLQRRPATRVAPVLAAIETLVPVLLAPLVVHEHWSRGPLGGGVVLGALVLVVGGAVLLSRASGVSSLIEGGAKG